jgi:hypothetical protein
MAKGKKSPAQDVARSAVIMQNNQAIFDQLIEMGRALPKEQQDLLREALVGLEATVSAYGGIGVMALGMLALQMIMEMEKEVLDGGIPE